MTPLINFFWENVIYTIPAIIIYIICKMVYFKKKNIKPNAYREFVLFVFFLYMAVLFSQTITLPKTEYLLFRGFTWDEYSSYIPAFREGNLVPFKTIQQYFIGENPEGEKVGTLINLFNVIMLVPFGILLPFTFKKFRRWYYTIPCGLALVVFIEVMQYFVRRVPDIDDAILNFIGVIIGYILWLIFKAFEDKFEKMMNAFFEKIKKKKSKA